MSARSRSPVPAARVEPAGSAVLANPRNPMLPLASKTMAGSKTMDVGPSVMWKGLMLFFLKLIFQAGNTPKLFSERMRNEVS